MLPDWQPVADFDDSGWGVCLENATGNARLPWVKVVFAFYRVMELKRVVRRECALAMTLGKADQWFRVGSVFFLMMFR